MLKSIITNIKDSHKEKRQQEIDSRRAEIKKEFIEFLKGEGKLPEGFSEPYNRTFPDGYIIKKTPFEDYLKDIGKTVDKLTDESGISEWLYLDDSADLNTAATEICDWIKRHRAFYESLREKCRVGNSSIILTEPTYGDAQIMVVVSSKEPFFAVSEAALQDCAALGISFCTIVSECSLYDLLEQKEKTIVYETYPNYHDETYANWSFK